MQKLRTAILGASGYTAAELLRLSAHHPALDIVALTGNSRAGERLEGVYPNFIGGQGNGKVWPELVDWQEVDWGAIDLVFACLPHGASQDTIAQISPKVGRVIDLSADFRLKDAALYEATYGRSHDSAELLEKAVYGLTEYARDELKEAKLIACPGCYPTATLLTLMPGLKSGALDTESIVIDAKSGVTGAGRKGALGLSYSELSDGAHAYGVGNHRHAPEIDYHIGRMTGVESQVSFTPHLLPMNRGMIVTCYAKLANGQSYDSLRKAYQTGYKDEPFVHVLPEGQVPQTRHVRGSNHVQIGLFKDRREGHVILIGVIDNLTKGSSGQAIQNLNVAMGWEEVTGLQQTALFP